MNVAAAMRITCSLAVLLACGCTPGVMPAERGQVLWVDDRPEGNREETIALLKMGLQVVTASSNAQAVELFRTHRYVLVISDIHRGNAEPATAGLQLPAALRRVRAELPPVIYYVGQVGKPQTGEGHPVVSEPSELLRLVESRLATPR